MGKKTEGGIVFELSPKNFTTSSKASCGDLKEAQSAHKFSQCANIYLRHPRGVRLHLSDSCVLLQLVEARFVPADEVFERGVVLDAELSPGELHTALQFFHITEDVLQTHCSQVRMQR